MIFEPPPKNLDKLQRWLNTQKETAPTIKPQAKASIIWANPENIQKTDFALLYLHGFKASHGEGDPIHKHIASKLGCNLYLSRLSKHGLNDADAFKNLQSTDFITSAEQALNIARRIGKKVIIMGTSTGGSLGLYLAGKKEYKETISALLLYSPLIKFYGLQSIFLSTNMGRSITKLFAGTEYRIASQNQTKAEDAIWYSSYHIQGALALGQFVQKQMQEDLFSSVNCPVFTAYYYNNFWAQDKVVSVRAIRQMFRRLGTPQSQKKLMRLPLAQTHVISSGLLSNCVDELEDASISFLQKQLEPNQL